MKWIYKECLFTWSELQFHDTGIVPWNENVLKLLELITIYCVHMLGGYSEVPPG